MRTLIVRYTPRTGSNTAKLVEAVQPSIAGEIEELELSRDLPELFDTQRVNAYGARNYGGQTLSPADVAAMAQMDRFAEQVQRADTVILAYPMYNFGVPAAVKAWFDAVLQKGKTWDAEKGAFTGLMKGKRALVLMTSAGTYADEYPASWDTATPQSRIAFSFMGFDSIEFAPAHGMSHPAQQGASIAAAAKQARSILERWGLTRAELPKAA